jgi:hypothetical protein
LSLPPKEGEKSLFLAASGEETGIGKELLFSEEAILTQGATVEGTLWILFLIKIALTTKGEKSR